MSFVVDASVTLAWCFEDEADRYSESVLDRLRTDNAVVPAIWMFEIVNALLTAERHGRLEPNESPLLLRRVLELPIRVDAETSPGLLLENARGSKLSASDAAYLELALRLGVPLATNDRQLRTAAHRMRAQILRA